MFAPTQEVVLAAGYASADFDRAMRGEATLPELLSRRSRMSGLLRAAGADTGPGLLEGAMVLPLGDGYSNTQIYYTYNYVWRRLRTDNTEFVNLPFEMRPDAHHDAPEDAPAPLLPRGGIVRFQAQQDDWRLNRIELYAPYNQELSSGVPLYVSNIAILKVRDSVDNGGADGDRDLTYSSTYFCRVLQSYLGVYRACFLRDQYEKYLEAPGKKEVASIVYVTPEDINDGFLYEPAPEGSAPGTRGPRRFGLIMIPDIILGTDQKIAERLGASGAQAIREYTKEGGSVFISGKGLRVAERIGLAPNGATDTSTLLTASKNRVGVAGCKPSELSQLNESDSSTAHRMLCQSLRCPESIAGKFDSLPPLEERLYEQYLLSSYPVDAQRMAQAGGDAPHWTQLMSFDGSQRELRLKNVRSGRSDTTTDSFPMAFAGSYGSGRLLVNLAHPSASTEADFPLLFNSVLFLMSRPAALNTYPVHTMRYPADHENAGELMPFPAGESDLSLTVVSQLMNLHQKPITDVVVRVEFIRQLWPDVSGLPGITNPPPRPGDPEDAFRAFTSAADAVAAAAGEGVTCTITDDASQLELNGRDDGYTRRWRELRYGLECHVATLAGHSALSLRVPTDVIDSHATTWGVRSPIVASRGIYTRGGTRYTLKHAESTLAVAMTPHLVGELNLDPLGTYPLPGRGFTADTILSIQNREDASALNTSFSTVVPLAAPSAVGGNQESMAEHLAFLPEYYELNGWPGREGIRYSYPFEKRPKIEFRDNDYIDLRSLAGKGISLVVEWDDPTYVVRGTRSQEQYMSQSTVKKPFHFKPISIDSQFSEAELLASIERARFYDAESTHQVYRQQYYADADQFLEHANFRLMPYAETWTEDGYRTYCEDYKANKNLGAELVAERRRHCARLAHPRAGAVGGRHEMNIQRLDAYFRTNTFYDMQKFRFSPTGLEELVNRLYPNDADRMDLFKTVFTIDRYGDHDQHRAPARDPARPTDASKLVETPLAHSLEVAGYMSNRQSWVEGLDYTKPDGTTAKRPYVGPGLHPNEWANPFLADDTGRWVVHWDDLPELDPARPIVDQPLHQHTWYWSLKTGFPDAIDYRDFMDFHPVDGGAHRCGVVGDYRPISEWDRANGRPDGTAYPEVRVLRAYSLTIGVPSQRTELGGEIVIDLPKGFTWDLSSPETHPVRNGWVQWSVDHIAIMDTRVETVGDHQRVVGVFRRGNQSDQRYSVNPSTVGVILAGLRSPEGHDGALQCNAKDDTYTYPELEATVSVRQLYWDFNAPSAKKIESYRRVAALHKSDTDKTFVESRVYPLTADVFVTMPGVYFEFPLLDMDGNPAEMRRYERFDQYARFRSFYQELGAHRTLWGEVETHSLHSDPGVCAGQAAFSVPTGVGIATVPFHDYVNTGTLAVPYGQVTAQARWTDIWGRRHAQPMRSVFLDVPPIPPPVRNYWMQTSFEVLDSETGERYQEWPAGRPVKAHIVFNVLNNYPKYFDITRCAANSYALELGSKGSGTFWSDVIGQTYPQSAVDLATQRPDLRGQSGVSDVLVKEATNSKYGACFADVRARLNGKNVTPEEILKMAGLQTCAGDRDDCETYMLEPGREIKRAPGTNTTTGGGNWNYSPFVDDFYPEHYIDQVMWRLQHYDYSDTAYDKAYPFHMDNRLPSIYGNPPNVDNILSIPVWKGFGYNVTFNPDSELPADPATGGPRRGTVKWGETAAGVWSDNLQNSDSTLLAGQDVSMKYPLGVPATGRTLQPGDWTDALTLTDAFTGGSTAQAVQKAVRNGLICLFNRDALATSYRPEAEAGEPLRLDQLVFRENVMRQNVVPVPINFDKKNSFYKTFTCEADTQQYRWNEIRELTRPEHPYTNYKKTNDQRDFMQFAFNLRGGAIENLHLVLDIEPMDPNHEGDLKVFDGARFAYWNPALTRTAWLVVDSNTHIIPAVQSNLELAGEILPNWAMTSDPRFWLSFNLLDVAEWNNGKLREVTNTYTLQNYGYGDFTVQVNGGQASTRTILQPGETFTAMVEFVNNAGFDMHLTPQAFEGTDACLAMAKEAYAARQAAGKGKWPILFDYCPSGVLNATAYNFIQVDEDRMEPALRGKVSVGVSKLIMVDGSGDEEKGIEPVFFDLIDANAPRFRNAFRGQYWLDVTIAEDFPRAYRGRLHEIPLKFVSDGNVYRLPGARCTSDAERRDETAPCDPTGPDVDHDYTIEIPPITFAVPYPKDKEFAEFPYSMFAGRVFTASGENTDIELTFQVPPHVDINRGVFLNAWQLDEFRRLIGRYSPVDAVAKMRQFFEKRAAYQPAVSYTIKEVTDADATADVPAGWRTVSVRLDDSNPASDFVDAIPAETAYDEDLYKPGRDVDDGGHREHTDDWNHYSLPALGSMNLVFNATMPFTAFGFADAARNPVVNFSDAFNERKSAADSLTQHLIEVKGASLVTTFQHAIVDSDTLLPLAGQWLVENSVNTLQFTITATNDGDDACFNVRSHIALGGEVTILTEESYLPDDVSVRVHRNGTVEVASSTALSPGETLVLPFYATVKTGAAPVPPSDDLALGPEGAAVFRRAGADDNGKSTIDVLTSADALYELKSYGRTSAVVQPLVMDGTVSYGYGPAVGVPLPITVEHDPKNPTVALLSTELPADDPSAEVCRDVPGVCRFAWSWRYEGADTVFNVPVFTDVPELAHTATTGFAANVTYKVTLTRVYDEVFGPQAVATSPTAGIHFNGTVSTIRLAVLATIYTTLCVVLGFLAFGYETVGRWAEVESLSRSFPFVPLDTTDKVEVAVVREVNRECIRSGRTVRLAKVSSTEYDVGGCRLTVATLKNALGGLRKPKFTAKGVDAPADFRKIANQFCLVDFTDDVLAELPRGLRDKITRHSKLPHAARPQKGYVPIDDVSDF